MKEYMQPKWWLTGVGTIFTIFMLLTYAEISNAAETGWGADNYDDRDVFYEKAWASTFLIVAIITIVSGQFVEGRAQAILAITIGGGNILTFILTFLAAGDLEYGYTDNPGNWALPMIFATCLLVSGYLHLEEE
jgi:molybdopterin-binding protein